MKKFFRITTKEMRYGICGPKFWGTVVTLAVLMLIDTLPWLYAGRTVDATGTVSFRTDILTLSLMTATGAGYIFYLRFCMYVIPYGYCAWRSAGSGRWSECGGWNGSSGIQACRISRKATVNDCDTVNAENNVKK